MNGMRLVPSFSQASWPGKTEAGAGRSIAGLSAVVDRPTVPQSRTIAVPRAASGRPPAAPHPNRIMIARALVVLACLIAPAMTLAQSSPNPPVAPREPKDVTVHGDRRIDDYFWLRQRDDPRTLTYLRAENAYADAWFAAARGAEGAALPGDVRPDPAGRRLGALSQGPLVVLEPHPEGRPVPALHPPPRARQRAQLRPAGQATRRCST